MEEIISLFFKSPLFVQILLLGVIFIFLALLIIVTVFHKPMGIKSWWFMKFTSTETEEELAQSKKQLEESKSTINDLKQKIEELRRPVEVPVIVEPPPLPGRYFIGIDIGRDKIDYCLIDYDKFKEKAYNAVKVIEGTSPTPEHFTDIYPKLVDIVRTLSQGAPRDVSSIDGIGLGLPGQVDPREGLLLNSPGFDDVDNEPLVQKFSDRIRQELRGSLGSLGPSNILRETVPIEIDNDVRCATRYVWKRYSFDDVICIFVGMGLGSGIVLGGKMLYGYNFTAGEIGHTTISESCGFLKGQTCACGLNGYHWEMYVSGRGMMNIAQTLDPKEYKRLRKDHDSIIQGAEYQRLLEQKAFSDHLEKHFDENNELTTYFFSLAFYAGEQYASKLVKEFIDYLAIGIANYINVINPRGVYLGGGMIRGFYDNRYKSRYLRCTTEVLLRRELNKYALPSARQVAIVRRDYTETRIASMGAALMLKDQSYFDYKKRSKEAQ